MRTFHSDFAWVVVATNLAAGLWGLYLWRKRKSATRIYWRALGVAWATIFIQGFAGLTLFNRSVPRPPFKHTFYGFLFVIVVLMVFPLRSEDARTRLLLFAGATTFIGIVAVRAALSL